MIKFEQADYYYDFDNVEQKLRVLLFGCSANMKQAHECFQNTKVIHSELIPVSKMDSFTFGTDELNILIHPFENAAVPSFYEWETKMKDLDDFYRDHQFSLGTSISQRHLFSDFLKQGLILTGLIDNFKSVSMMKFIDNDWFPKQVKNLILKMLHDIENEELKEVLK